MFKNLLIIAMLVLSTFSLNAQERKEVSVTVYNKDLGVIREKRVVDINKGISEVRITDIPENIDPTSVLAKFDGEVLEQNYQYDLINVQKILARYIGMDITLIGNEKTIFGKLLSSNTYQIVVQTNDGNILMINELGKYQVVVKDLPSGLITKPTLVWKVDSKKSGKQEIEITYSTIGMNWHAEYVALLNENDTKASLNSWVSISNNSGGSFPDAELKLIAGDVNRAKDRLEAEYEVGMMDYAMAPSRGKRKDFAEKALFEYHIFNLDRKTSINNNETKQIALLSSDNVDIIKKFKYNTTLYSTSENNKVGVFVEFKNSEMNSLGVPMPKGKVRIFKSDGNSKEFVGEDFIDHTPKEETVKVKVGDAFDILVDEVLENEKRISDRVNVREVKLTIKNRKDEKAKIEIDANMGWGNWEILDSNVKYEKKDANSIIIKVDCDKNSETSVKMKIRNQY